MAINVDPFNVKEGTLVTKLAVEKISGHEEFQGNFWLDGKFWDLGGAVRVANLTINYGKAT